MKNFINYFYNIELDNIRMIDDNYYFTYRDNNFILHEIKDNYFDYILSNELNSLLIKNRNNFFRIIPNKNNNVITSGANKKYILMLENFSYDRDFDYLDVLDTNIAIDENEKIINKKSSNNWAELWKRKIDYFEAFIENNINKYPNLNEYYNYFIGLSENAIAYYEETIEVVNPTNYDKLVVSHKRIEDYYTYKDLYAPFSLTVDHPSRDLSEYLKMIFWSNKYNNQVILECLNNVRLSNFGARILLARLMYPSFFFDVFEKLIDNESKIKDMFQIINRMAEYEKYLLGIYTILKNKYYIEEISWIKKVDYSSTLITPKTSGISLISMDSIPSFNVTSIMLQ